MNLIETSLKALTCALGAVAVTAVMSAALVQSTAEAPWGAAVGAHMAKLTSPGRHLWFGQSQPAVLVD